MAKTNSDPLVGNVIMAQDDMTLNAHSSISTKHHCATYKQRWIDWLIELVSGWDLMALLAHIVPSYNNWPAVIWTLDYIRCGLAKLL